MITLKSSFNLRKIFATILLCSMLGYFSLSLTPSWMKITDAETKITKYFGNISISDRYKTVNLNYVIKRPIREGFKVGKKKVWSEVRGQCHTFYFMLKMAYNSSRNAKKILGRGGANPLNCHTKWGGGIKKKSVTNVTLFFYFLLWHLPIERKYFQILLIIISGFRSL